MAMTLRLTDEQDELLESLAKALQVSKQEAVIRAIEEQSARIGVAQDVSDFADQAFPRYAALLHRLAQ